MKGTFNVIHNMTLQKIRHCVIANRNQWALGGLVLEEMRT